jgi:quercetin dioxygenase-like cupin family protein
MTKRYTVLLLLLLIIVFFGASVAFAEIKTYIIENGKDGYPVAMDKGPLAIAGEGWAAGAISEGGVDFYVFRAAPNAPLEAHKSPESWIGYVVSGSGELGLTDESGNQKSVIRYKPGDIMVFRPDTMHSWKNGSTEAVILFVKTSQ